MCKKLVSLFITLVMTIGILFSPANQGTVAAESATINIGDYIQFGRYYDEPILWRVINKDVNGTMILSEKILCLLALACIV